MKTKELIEEKKQIKEIFSLHTLVNDDHVDPASIPALLEILLEDANIYTYIFMICPKCGSKVLDASMSEELFRNQKTCNNCKAKFKPEHSNCEFVFDPRPLKDRM